MAQCKFAQPGQFVTALNDQVTTLVRVERSRNDNGYLIDFAILEDGRRVPLSTCQEFRLTDAQLTALRALQQGPQDMFGLRNRSHNCLVRAGLAISEGINLHLCAITDAGRNYLKRLSTISNEQTA